jgi:bacteriorhodopsin
VLMPARPARFPSTPAPHGQFFTYVLWNLVFAGRAASKLQSDKVQRVYLIALMITVISWIGYPIVLCVPENRVCRRGNLVG